MTQAEKDFETITENIYIESGRMFADEGSKEREIRLLEAALLQALQERDQWKETAIKYQSSE